MALIWLESGEVVSLMECPHCGSYTTHARAEGREQEIFQCALCFAMFTDSD